MDVYLDSENNNYFKFVIISKPSKNNFSTEKPSKDKEHKDNMSTSSSSPSNNEKLDEKKQNSQEVNKPPEVKVDSPDNNGDLAKDGDSAKEQKNEEKSSRLTIEVPSKSTTPQFVTSPSEIRAKTPEPAISPISPQSSNIFKKLGNIIKNSSENGTTPDQEEVATSDSKDQMQKEQQVVNNTVANDNITENTENTVNTVNTERSIAENKEVDEDKKNTPEPTAVKQRTGSLSSLVNMKMFITRTSSLFVEKLKEEFDNLDRRIYPDMDPDWVVENQSQSSREAAISEREQLLENKDVEITNGTSPKPQSTQNIMAEVGVALNERKEKLENIGQKTEELNNNSSNFLELATQLREKQEKNNKSWFW